MPKSSFPRRGHIEVDGLPGHEGLHIADFEVGPTGNISVHGYRHRSHGEEATEVPDRLAAEAIQRKIASALEWGERGITWNR